MTFGIVKTFDNEKGYGLIQPAEGGRALFVTCDAVERAGIEDLFEGQRLQYELEHDIKGRSSVNNLKLM